MPSMKSPGNMLRYCKLRISAMSNRREDASKGTVPLSMIQDGRPDKEMEEEIVFEEIGTPEAEEKGGGKIRRQLFQRLRQIAARKRLAGFSEFEEDENTYTEDDTISDVEEKDDNHFFTSFDWVGGNDSAVAITVITEVDSVQKNQDEVVDNQVGKLELFRAEDIWTACKVGDEDFVKNAIANDPDLVHLAENGRTPLYNACLCGHERIVKILLEAGAEDLDRTAYIAALSSPCQELLLEHESNQRAQIQKEIAKRLVDDGEKGGPTPETAAILKDLTNTPLGAQGTIFLDNDVFANIDYTSTYVNTPNDIGNSGGNADVENDIGSGETSMDVDNANANNGGDADSNERGKSDTSATDVEAIEESFHTLYNVFVPFQSHLMRTKNEGFEAILEPVIKSGEEGNDTTASDVSFDSRLLNDVVEFIQVFTGQDGISGGPGGLSPASDGNISSKLDNIKAKHSSSRAHTSSLLSKYANDTDGTLSTDEQTFASEGDSYWVEASEGDSYWVEDLYDTNKLPFMSFGEITKEIEFTFCALLFPDAQA